MAAQVSVLTQHNDNARSGVNSAETLLTPANVSSNKFGLLNSVPVDGYVYTQPLYVPNVSVPSVGIRNVVYVATQHDSVYAIDADTGAVLWHVSFINPALGITPIPETLYSCDDIKPEIGITSTPVIDANTATMYVVALTEENGAFVARLHALDISTGAEKFGGPVALQATVQGNGTGSSGGSISFNALWENQRAGLLLVNGTVYIGFASHCDEGPYHGWVLGYNAASLRQTAVFNTTPNGNEAGIWQAGGGLSADAAGNLFVV
ncbi:MAG: PQQ-binding-like beta-propeller repeat protein, partial [Acidobacteria bacterium]|nr:PQQ-binding-like beta-propeller repeat protein [Acidobacteriota bacterium]